MRKLLLVPALAALGLCGCSVGHTEYSRTALSHVDMSFTGVPTLLGLGTLGTTIPLTPEYSLTAAHVAKFALQRVKAYHPYCDVAIIYHKNSPDTLTKFRSSEMGEPIKMYGYSFVSALPVESEGVNLARTTIRNLWNKKPCMAVASNAGVVQGMSGGGVYNRDDTLAGVIVGYTSGIKNNRSGKVFLKDVSLYIPYGEFKTWLQSNINQAPGNSA
ncbi:trypsin-like peptidase domain-containing protein [Candidatus Pantoea multigeneris]|uniref:Trypsin-like peptidase domain-containing protein n=1 Tax=Candidatus Pantoea multigeneris TaxID=2608357 RepID=A0ABX0R975_9GAMM|nr:trypsin-like peptidase domain-containing protein [Pantoea multigeneris]NIF21937.1 trypsin-like peptidase domain-containing protein [Pantoea multigeneris]